MKTAFITLWVMATAIWIALAGLVLMTSPNLVRDFNEIFATEYGWLIASTIFLFVPPLALYLAVWAPAKLAARLFRSEG